MVAARFYRIVVILALAVSLLACGDGGQVRNSPAEPAPLFADNFSPPKGNWDQVENLEGITNFKDGAYRIVVNTVNTDLWANPGLNFTDVRIEVKATKAGGPDDNEFGVICRYRDMQNFYYFVITSDGYYGIFKVKDGINLLINRSEMPPSEHIRAGTDTNLLRADCVGSTLSWYANDELLDRQEDGEFLSGDVGLIAGTFDEPGTEILFDDFVVREP